MVTNGCIKLYYIYAKIKNVIIKLLIFAENNNNDVSYKNT